MDLNITDLIKEAAARHQTLLTPNDPILVTLTLNQLVFDAYMKRVNEALSQFERQLEDQRVIERKQMQQIIHEVLEDVRRSFREAPRAVDDHARSVGVEVAGSFSSALDEIRKLHEDVKQKQFLSNVLLIFAGAMLIVATVLLLKV